MQDAGICVILALIGVFLTAILIIKNVKGNILWGILGTLDSRYYLPVYGAVCAEPGDWILQSASGFLQRAFPCRVWHRSL